MKVLLGEDYDKFQEALSKEAPTAIRLNPRKRNRQPLPNHPKNPIPWCSSGFTLTSRPVFTLDPAFHAGTYYVQEPSSMFLEQVLKQLLPDRTGLKILDLCGAPGGKSTHLLSLIDKSSLLVSNETIKTRAGILRNTIERWGAPNAMVTSNDPSDFKVLQGFFDLIVIDAPCSGEGLFRKDPAAIDHWSIDHTEFCAARQQRILEEVWPALKEGGLLVYSTCTFNQTENEKNLLQLKSLGASSVGIKVNADWNIHSTDEGGMLAYRFYPHRIIGEGFFMAVVRKTGSLGSATPVLKRSSRDNSVKETKAFSKEFLEGDPKQWIIENHNTESGAVLGFYPATLEQDVHLLRHHLRVLSSGTIAGTIKKEKLIPHHGLAFSTALRNEVFTSVELSHNDALHYLKKDNLMPNTEKKGMVRLTYGGDGLGWGNILENRMNNLLPSGQRILMDLH
ncbi:MAG: rRNA methyltransferase [Bacteroidetes bacterium]|nr:rRNA methyltransferase [Bacteroidota bacterium]